MPLMVEKKALVMAVLYAVPPTLPDVERPMRQPCVLNGFHETLTGLPDCTERLTGLALLARLCVTETSQKEVSSSLPSMLWPYCIKAQRNGLFQMLYTTLTHMLKVTPHTKGLGLAALVFVACLLLLKQESVPYMLSYVSS